MVKTCNMSENDVARLHELKKKTEASTDSEVIRAALREYHKKIFSDSPTMDCKRQCAE